MTTLVPVLEIFMPPDVCLKRVYLLTYLLHPLETPEALSSQPVSMVIVWLCASVFVSAECLLFHLCISRMH